MTYEQALAEVRDKGLRNCSDAAAMAAFCESTLVYMVGAVSGRLVWEGAKHRGMSYLELAGMAAHNPMQVNDLQWIGDEENVSEH